jgi:hypothetical protein
LFLSAYSLLRTIPAMTIAHKRVDNSVLAWNAGVFALDYLALYQLLFLILDRSDGSQEASAFLMPVPRSPRQTFNPTSPFPVACGRVKNGREFFGVVKGVPASSLQRA